MRINQEKNIVFIYPIDFYELVFEFTENEFRVFSPEKLNLYENFDFLAYPNKLKCFEFSESKIQWKNGVEFDSAYIYKNSTTIKIEDLSNSVLTIDFKNQAPTLQNQNHHEYRFSIRPFDKLKPYVLSESIGGGHFDSGGWSILSYKELLDYHKWKEHITLSNCEWAIEFLKNENNETETELIKKIILKKIKNTIFE